jgi:hypothetical protein
MSLPTKSDLKMFEQLGVPAELVAAAQIERVTDDEAREYGITRTGDMGGIVFPYFIPSSTHRVTCRLRRDHPEIEGNKPKNKYMAPINDVRHLYFPPGAGELLEDSETEIVFVEAEKSVLAMLAWAQRAKRKLLPIGTGGCYGWRGRIGKTVDGSGARVDEVGPLPDLDCVDGRKVYILFDSNCSTNTKVQSARCQFAVALRKLGAAVTFVNLPTDNVRINGPDDFVGIKGDLAMAALFSTSSTSKSAITASEPIEVATESEINLPDMPDTVFDGKLGEICQRRLGDFPNSFGWLALPAAAGVLVRPTNRTIRTNLYVALVGKPGSGKSQVIDRSIRLMDLRPPFLEEIKAGSIEGLLKQRGDKKDPFLLFPDELSHLFEKAAIPNASFPYILNSAFYKDEVRLTIAHGAEVNFSSPLSIIGGIVGEKFEDSFGSATTAGTYDRFFFGQAPTGRDEYEYRPWEGPAAFDAQVDEVPVNRDVWDARDEIAKRENLSRRLLEIALRVAMICASFDGRKELRAQDLGPAWELARYQSRVRLLLRPNPGKNFEAQVAAKIVNYLNRYAPDGKWLVLRKVLHGTNANDYGPSVAKRALDAMSFSGSIEQMEQEMPKGPRRRLVRLAVEAVDQESATTEEAEQ